MLVLNSLWGLVDVFFVFQQKTAYYVRISGWSSDECSSDLSLTVAAIVVPLAYAFAYALQRTCVPAKGLWRGISLLPLLAPSILPGIALIYLFGNQGALRHLLTDNIYGFWGIVIDRKSTRLNSSH